MRFLLLLAPLFFAAGAFSAAAAAAAPRRHGSTCNERACARGLYPKDTLAFNACQLDDAFIFSNCRYQFQSYTQLDITTQENCGGCGNGNKVTGWTDKPKDKDEDGKNAEKGAPQPTSPAGGASRLGRRMRA